ncbi:MAG: UDP-glucose 4-epimerase GalE [Puniceicoccaceae bacterium]
MKEKILVTGGAGYIGSHTVVELIEQDHEVVVVDDLSNSEESVLDGIEAITGVRPDLAVFDLCDEAKLELFFQAHPDIAAVIHFAAAKAVGESVERPLHYYRNNLLSLINLLEVLPTSRAKGIVFSSSCTVYGQPEKLPVGEDAPIQPALSPYGNTKQVCEEILRDAVAAGSGHRVISLRYFNPIGAHPSARIGELPRGVPNNLVPFITQTGAGIRERVRIFGDDYDTPDGTCIRDYIHVVDLAKAHVMATERLLRAPDAPAFEFFNLGTGRGSSVKEIVDTFEKVSGLDLPKEIAPRRPGDVQAVYADTRKANEVLGWKAGLGLEEMISSAWEWEKRLRGIDS